MTEGAGFSVDLPQLRVHAATAGRMANHLEVVAGAAAHVARLDDAYGLIPNMLGWPDELIAAQHEAAELVDRCTRQLREASYQLHQSVFSYEEYERRIEHAIGHVVRKMGGDR